jgi:hypothetical protein
MSYSAQSFVSNIDLAKLLKTYQTNGVYSNLSDSSEVWKYFLKQRAGDAGGDSLTYLLRTSLGPAAVQSLPAGSSGDYPTAQRAGFSKGTAQYKEFGLTVNIPRNLIGKTGSDLLRYAEPLTEEMDAKAIAAARVMSLEMMGDGSGAIGVVASVGTPDTTNDQVTITLSVTSANSDRSHVGWFMEDDQVKFATTAGTSHATINNAGTTVAYWKVVSRDDDANTVTLAPYDSSDALINITSTSLGATDPTAADLIYRRGTTANDTTAISTNDYNTLSECLVGLPSLIADDGRKVNGITMTGAVSGSWRDASGAAIDSSDFQRVLSKGKRRAGRNRYKYRQAWMFDNVYDTLVESSETDRRFQVGEGSRGVKSLGYQHGKDFVEFMPDEFVPKQRIYILPESKEVLQMYGQDFKTVEPNPGQKFHLKTSSTGAGHSRQMNAYMEGAAVVICKHPAAVLAIKNFSAS